jgi:hypothetical protein
LFQGDALRLPPVMVEFALFFLRLPPDILRVRRVPAMLFYLGNRKSTRRWLTRGGQKSERGIAPR